MHVGDRVRLRATGEEGVVVADDGGFLEVALPSGRVFVHRDDVESRGKGPPEQLSAGVVGHSLPYGLRLKALFLKHAYAYDPLSSLSNARIEPTLHQVYIAHTVAQKLKPRMILADEVGLGKTIEAGLIIKELRARGLVERALVICPASLQLQWQNELRSKFNEDFQLVDGAAVKFLGRDGGNPWEKTQNAVCSLAFAANPKNAEKIVDAGWDIVVFDEAHRVRRQLEGRNRYRTTQAYRLADDLKDQVDGLLLLTATPMQLHPYELYSLIELVEPGLYSTYLEYETKRRDLPSLNELMKLLKGWGAYTRREKAVEVERHRDRLARLGVEEEDLVATLQDDERRSAVMNGLVDRHPLAGVLVRNRKAEVGGFTKREASRFLVDLSAEELAIYDEVTAYLQAAYGRAQAAKNQAVGFVMVGFHKMLTSSSYAIRQSLKRRAEKLRAAMREAVKQVVTQQLRDYALNDLRDAEEESVALEQADGLYLDQQALAWEISVLDRLIERLGRIRDSKAAKLLEVLRIILDAHPDEKVLIFTQYIETQLFLAGILVNRGYSTVIFNGQMKLEAKEEAVAQFRHSAQVLVSTEAGGEGRNFQFCHIMVNYDLPWNPMKVEQRIGRLDRIGQRRPVIIYNLACARTLEERVLEVLERRIGLFEESVGSLDPILGEVERDIEQIAMEHAARLDEAFEELEMEIEKRVLRAREQERTLADFVLDRHSLRRDVVDQILGRTPLASSVDLQEFIGEALAYYGGSLDKHPDGGHVISLSIKLAVQLKAKKAVTRGCFDLRQAQSLEHLDFFALGHDLIDSIVDLPLTSEPSVTGARRTAGRSRGLHVEVFYQIRGGGARPSGKIIRHLVDEKLNIISEELASVPTLGNSLEDLKVPAWAASAVKSSMRQFQSELAKERTGFSRENEALKEEELGRANRIFRYREVRLQRLIEEQARWIQEKERSGTERERRILPARRGRFAKDQERLERLRLEYDKESQAIRDREPSVVAEPIAAGLVMSR